jgi:WD repeat-containing protein mio
MIGEKSQSRLIDSTVIPDATQWERLVATLNKRASRPHFNSIETTKPHHRQLCLAICGLSKSNNEFEQDLQDLEEQGKHTKAAAFSLFEGFPERAIQILKNGGTDLLFVAMALDIKLKSSAALELNTNEWATALENHPQMAEDPYLRAIYGYITAGDWQVIADETSLPLRDRVGVALRRFDDDKLTNWLSTQMEEATVNGDLEGIVLAGITDNMVDILAKYIEKFMDYQTPILIMSFCYPRYIDDIRCDAWRKNYKDFLQRHKKFIRRVMFEQQSTIKSRTRDGTPVIKPPPRQVTIRCLNCDAQSANDLGNSGAGSSTSAGPSSITADTRNPLTASSTIAGLCCPRCGSHLPRCAVCMEIVGMPRSDRPEQSTDVTVRRMANFPTFCLKCKHVMHMDHSIAWFSRHMECPVPECQCKCNDKGLG